MKSIFAVIILLHVTCLLSAQAMTEEEKSLRNADAIASLLDYVKKNPTSNSLCRPNEYLIFGFTTTNNKFVSVCIAKNTTAASGYIVYRFGTKAKIEMEFPKDTVNSFSQFTYAGYHRGGGIQNACMDLDEFRFTNNEHEYEIVDTYTCEENKREISIDITVPTTKKTVSIKAKGKMTGSIMNIKDVVNQSDEL